MRRSLAFFASLAAVAALGVSASPLATAATNATPVPTWAPLQAANAVPAAKPATAVTAPAPVTIVAAAKQKRTAVFAAPGAAKPFVTLDNKTNYSGRHVFVVVGQQAGWLKVQVPVRPNGTTGFVRAADVSTYQHDWSIRVSLKAHRMTVFKGGAVWLERPVAVGSAKYPTPTGTYFLRELARPRNPKGAYGPYAYGVSAYSNVLQTFGRGDGQIGVHGTNRPDLLGKSVSHGCIRIDNASILKMAKVLPQGVPLVIEA